MLSLVFFGFVFQTDNISNINTQIMLGLNTYNYKLKIGIYFLIISCSIKSVQFLGHL